MARRRTRNRRTRRTRRKSTMRSTLERSLRKTIERTIRKSLKKLTNRKTKKKKRKTKRKKKLQRGGDRQDKALIIKLFNDKYLLADRNITSVVFGAEGDFKPGILQNLQTKDGLITYMKDIITEYLHTPQKRDGDVYNTDDRAAGEGKLDRKDIKEVLELIIQEDPQSGQNISIGGQVLTGAIFVKGDAIFRRVLIEDLARELFGFYEGQREAQSVPKKGPPPLPKRKASVQTLVIEQEQEGAPAVPAFIEPVVAPVAVPPPLQPLGLAAYIERLIRMFGQEQRVFVSTGSDADDINEQMNLSAVMNRLTGAGYAGEGAPDPIIQIGIYNTDNPGDVFMHNPMPIKDLLEVVEAEQAAQAAAAAADPGPDPELAQKVDAATKIQSARRGVKVRQEQQARGAAATKIQALQRRRGSRQASVTPLAPGAPVAPELAPAAPEPAELAQPAPVAPEVAQPAPAAPAVEVALAAGSNCDTINADINILREKIDALEREKLGLESNIASLQAAAAEGGDAGAAEALALVRAQLQRAAQAARRQLIRVGGELEECNRQKDAMEERLKKLIKELYCSILTKVRISKLANGQVGPMANRPAEPARLHLPDQLRNDIGLESPELNFTAAPRPYPGIPYYWILYALLSDNLLTALQTGLGGDRILTVEQRQEIMVSENINDLGAGGGGMQGYIQKLVDALLDHFRYAQEGPQ